MKIANICGMGQKISILNNSMKEKKVSTQSYQMMEFGVVDYISLKMLITF